MPSYTVWDWMDRQLSVAGIDRIGAVELRSDQPWARVFSATTSAGEVWLKVPAAGSGFEAGLYRILTQVAGRQRVDLGRCLCESGRFIRPIRSGFVARVERDHDTFTTISTSIRACGLEGFQS